MIWSGGCVELSPGGPRATWLGVVENLLAGVRGAAEGAGVLGDEIDVVFDLVLKGYGVCSVRVRGW